MSTVLRLIPEHLFQKENKHHVMNVATHQMELFDSLFVYSLVRMLATCFRDENSYVKVVKSQRYLV